MSDIKHGFTEAKDVDRNYVLLAATSFLALLILGGAAAGFLFRDKLSHQMSRETQYSTSIFPLPQLQPSPTELLRALHAHEDQVLNSYAKIDGEHARVPIARALELAVKKQLLERPPHAP